MSRRKRAKLKQLAANAQASGTVLSMPGGQPKPIPDTPQFRVPGQRDEPAPFGRTGEGIGYPSAGGSEPVFSAAEVEQLMYRRFNPLSILNAQTLSDANDGFAAGVLMQAARLWAEIARSDETIATVKPKREESVSQRNWGVVPLNDSPEAKDQAEALRVFYERSRATHAIKRHATGKMAMLLTQMMEARAFGYAAHHLMFKPSAEETFSLPSGKIMPGLSAVFEYVPMEYFEARTGVLRFLGMSLGWTGQPLTENEWMVSYSESPLMRAASVLHYYKRLATADSINFSEKFGQPGQLTHTTAQKGTPEGNAAASLSRSMGSNFRGVLYGAAENKHEVIWPSGGTSGADLPMHVIREDCKRELISLWLGSDLSTMSRGGQQGDGKAVGGLAQADAQEKREQADCAWVSETLNAAVDPIVIKWFFGEDAPILAKIVIEAPANEDRSQLANLIGQVVGMLPPGTAIAAEPVLKRLNIPIAKEGEAALQPPSGPVTDTPESPAINQFVGPDSIVIGRLMASAHEHFGEALADDFTPLRMALEKILQGDDNEIHQRVLALHAEMPALTAKIIQSDKSPEALYRILSAAAATGLSQEEPKS